MVFKAKYKLKKDLLFHLIQFILLKKTGLPLEILETKDTIDFVDCGKL
jgi:hypothetical protein